MAVNLVDLKKIPFTKWMINISFATDCRGTRTNKLCLPLWYSGLKKKRNADGSRSAETGIHLFQIKKERRKFITGEHYQIYNIIFFSLNIFLGKQKR